MIKPEAARPLFDVQLIGRGHQAVPLRLAEGVIHEIKLVMVKDKILVGGDGDEGFPAVQDQRHRAHGIFLQIDNNRRRERVRLDDGFLAAPHRLHPVIAGGGARILGRGQIDNGAATGQNRRQQ